MLAIVQFAYICLFNLECIIYQFVWLFSIKRAVKMNLIY